MRTPSYRATIPHSAYYAVRKAIVERLAHPPTFWQEVAEVLHTLTRGVLFGNWGD